VAATPTMRTILQVLQPRHCSVRRAKNSRVSCLCLQAVTAFALLAAARAADTILQPDEDADQFSSTNSATKPERPKAFTG
jgi:hypothetical protein